MVTYYHIHREADNAYVTEMVDKSDDYEETLTFANEVFSEDEGKVYLREIDPNNRPPLPPEPALQELADHLLENGCTIKAEYNPLGYPALLVTNLSRQTEEDAYTLFPELITGSGAILGDRNSRHLELGDTAMENLQHALAVLPKY